jgi:hypothetical protein
MTPQEKATFHKLHHLNRKSLENAIELIKEDIRNAYRREKDSNYIIHLPFTSPLRKKLLEDIRSYNRLLLGLMASWSDESIRRLYFEPNVFTDTQIDYLYNMSLQDKWKMALKISFCKAYSLVPVGDENCRTISSRIMRQVIDPNLYSKYEELSNMIGDFLIPAFNIRNKVQHGEWIAAFNSPDSKVYDLELTKNIFKENIVTISSRIVIFNSIYQMITDLARFTSNNFKPDPTTTPFEHFYDRYIKKIEKEIKTIKNPKLNIYYNTLITKKEKGKIYVRESINILPANLLSLPKKVKRNTIHKILKRCYVR